MRLATSELDSETFESNILPQKVKCEACGAQASLRAIFHYVPQPHSAEHPDEHSSPPVVMILKCPVCGPRTQIKAGDFAVER
jgi:Zn finger protein HypA/HybF involved in hydrogenase expression